MGPTCSSSLLASSPALPSPGRLSSSRTCCQSPSATSSAVLSALPPSSAWRTARRTSRLEVWHGRCRLRQPLRPTSPSRRNESLVDEEVCTLCPHGSVVCMESAYLDVMFLYCGVLIMV